MWVARGAAVALGVGVAVVAFNLAKAPAEPRPNVPAEPRPRAMGLLRVLDANPRYFTDGTGRAVYLTGSHVWWNRADRTWTHSCLGSFRRFDYDAHLARLQRLGHNFIRLWTWEL